MTMHVLEVTYLGKNWCRMEFTKRDNTAAIHEVILRMPISDGFNFNLYRATEARRILESSESGIKILSIDFDLEPIELPKSLDSNKE